jgi:predicted DNA-binding antitoxin AbrB/MazE fold protein
MTVVDAIFQGGVFKPLEQVGFAENQHVRLAVEPTGVGDAHAWLEETRRFREEVARTRGVFPDSALDIAADRAR